jgi:excisionase family DNA binding protein
MNMLTVKAAAKKIGISVSLIYELCAGGQLAHFRFGRCGKRGRIVIDEQELDRFMAACRKAGEPDQPFRGLRHITLG